MISLQGFPGGSDSNESAWRFRRLGLDPWVRKIPWRREWQPTPISLPEEFHGQRTGNSPWGYKELNMAEGLTHIITGGLGPLIFLAGYHTQSNKNRKGRKAKKERPILPEEKTCLPSHPEFQSALKDLCKNQMRNRSLHL